MEFKTLSNLAEPITKILCERIIRFELKPGERIMETKLAQEFGVSRGPIRDALRNLEEYQLVELIPRRGAIVSAITEEKVIWLYDVIKELLSLVVLLSVQNRFEEVKQGLEEGISRINQRQLTNEYSEYFEGVILLTNTCVKASNNPILQDILLNLMPSAQRLQYAAFVLGRQDLAQSAKFFNEAFSYAKSNNPEMASKTIKTLVEYEKQTCLRILREKNHYLSTIFQQSK